MADDIVRRLRAHALPDPHDEREVMHAPLLREAADEIERARAENDAIAGMNQEQFLELTFLRKVHQAAHALYMASEEYEFDDGLGKGADQQYWDDLAAAFEPETDAIAEVVIPKRRGMTTDAKETKEQVFLPVPLTCSDPEIEALGAVAYVLCNMKNPNGEAFTKQQKLRILRWNTERVQQYG